MSPLAPIACLVLASAAPPDRVTLANGETLEGRFLGVRDGRLRVEMRIGAGRAELACEIPRIARIEPGVPFSPAALPGDPAARVRALRPLWTAQAPLLATPGSDAGRIGLALAQALLEGGPDPEALLLLETLAARDPNPALRQTADALRVQVLVRQGRLDDAMALARRLGAETDDPSATAFACIAKGRAEAGRTNLDEAADHFLRVRLLFPDLREEAAQGLWEAAQIEISRTNLPSARRWLEVIATNYPNTVVSTRAAEALTAAAIPNAAPKPKPGNP